MTSHEPVLDRMAGRRVLVVGDVMLDRFVWGEVRRISPEAPVPVVRVTRETARLGGAANVAANLAALDSRAALIGLVGRDESAARLRAGLSERGIESLLVETPGRATTVKTRIIARSQQVVRVDREPEQEVGDAARAELAEVILTRLADADAMVISDYAKGVVDGPLMEAVLERAERRGVPVVVDPKPRNARYYRPITVITPNEAEAERITGLEIHDDEDCLAAAREILDRIDTRAALVTRGERGMLLLERGREARSIPTRARQVYDVTGAGDTVAAVVALGLAAGADLEVSARLASEAAGLVVGKVGTATVGLEELKSAGAHRSGPA